MTLFRVTRSLTLLLLVLLPAPAAADPDPAAAVEAAIARWELSCRAPNDLGDCTRTRTVKAAHHCGPEMREVENRRNARAARAAQAELVTALAALEKNSGTGDSQLAWVSVRARTAIAEAAYEEVLRLRFPLGLDFSRGKEKASRARFDAFLRDARNKLDTALTAYRNVAQHPGATTALRLRAVARRGQLSAHFTEIFLTAEIPRDVRTGEMAADKIDAYCDAVSEAVDPNEENARAAFEECLAMGAGMWAAVCNP